MIKTQTLQNGFVALPKRVAGRIEKIELPARKRKPPRTKQIGAIVGAVAALSAALFVGETVRRRFAER